MRLEIQVKLFNGKGRYRKGSCETVTIRGRRLPETHDVADYIQEVVGKQIKQGFTFRKHKERVIEV